MIKCMPVRLPKPSIPTDILIIAGEHSGDEHGALLVEKLLDRNPNLNIAAIGGTRLKKAGAQLLFDLTQHSVVGLWEVLKSYSFFRGLLGNTAEWIKENEPRVVCFIDYPGFNLRLAQRLYNDGLAQKSGGAVQLCYYIGPQIWAWKAGRRFKMAKYLDSLGVIFPFEVECYKDVELDVQFVGHPFAEENYQSLIEYSPEGKILLLPGSRKEAVSRIFPVMLDAFELLLEEYPQERAGIIVPSRAVFDVIDDAINYKPWLKAKIDFYKNSERVKAKAALGSSGTMSLKTTLAGIPGAILYKAHPITFWIGKRIAKISFLGIANILLGKAVYPEYLQADATKENLARELKDCIASDARRQAMIGIAHDVRERLSGEKETKAEDWLVKFL